MNLTFVIFNWYLHLLWAGGTRERGHEEEEEIKKFQRIQKKAKNGPYPAAHV